MHLKFQDGHHLNEINLIFDRIVYGLKSFWWHFTCFGSCRNQFCYETCWCSSDALLMLKQCNTINRQVLRGPFFICMFIFYPLDRGPQLSWYQWQTLVLSNFLVNRDIQDLKLCLYYNNMDFGSVKTLSIFCLAIEIRRCPGTTGNHLSFEVDFYRTKFLIYHRFYKRNRSWTFLTTSYSCSGYFYLSKYTYNTLNACV